MPSGTITQTLNTIRGIVLQADVPSVSVTIRAGTVDDPLQVTVKRATHVILQFDDVVLPITNFEQSACRIEDIPHLRLGDDFGVGTVLFQDGKVVDGRTVLAIDPIPGIHQPIAPGNIYLAATIAPNELDVVAVRPK